jgi:hypothetical protein
MKFNEILNQPRQQVANGEAPAHHFIQGEAKIGGNSALQKPDSDRIAGDFLIVNDE